MQRSFLYDIIRLVAPKAFSSMFRTYRYRVELSHAHGLTEKFPLLLQSFWRFFIDRKKILFYPDQPQPFHAIYKVLVFLGYQITTDTRKKSDIAIKWWLAFDGNPFAPEKSFPQVKNGIKSDTKLLNIRCNDISKARVNSVFEEIFGYSIAVDPQKYKGKCVMKTNWNALHKGQVIECPAKLHDGDFVYQKLILNEVKDGLVEDMRVPIFGNKTPFVYLKYRSVNDRFVDRKHTNKKAMIVEVSKVLSLSELRNIYLFCERIGLDCGELDVLRDRDDGRIYIVDANNTPSGPPSAISEDDGKVAVLRMSQAFKAAFEV